MTSASLVLTPLDTLFFRDGRPFDVDDEGLVEAASLFPPHPSVVAGAVRAAYARRGGWSGRRAWSRANEPSLAAWLGDGDELGRMRYRGPFLLERGIVAGTFLVHFPCPAALLGRCADASEVESGELGANDLAELRLLRPPSDEGTRSDLDGRIRPAELGGGRPEEFDALTDHWVGFDLMRDVLAGAPFKRLSRVVGSGEVYRREKRLGLERSLERHATIEGRLYATAKVRMQEPFALGLVVDSTGADDLALAGVLPLGGEARAASVETLAAPAGGASPIERDIAGVLPTVADFATDGGIVRYMIVMLTPAKVVAGDLSALPGSIVAAAHDRAEAIGMWRVGQPGGMSLFYPAGTTWFFEAGTADGADVRERLEALRGTGLGAHRGLGFGEFVYGVWKPND